MGKNKIMSEKECSLSLQILSLTKQFFKKEQITESSNDGKLIKKLIDFIFQNWKL